MDNLLDNIRKPVRHIISQFAKQLNSVSGGKISPNIITLIGLIAHIFIALLIVKYHFIAAGLLLIFFGLFDTLDGELARLQKKASNSGMLLDATTDRMKEILLYTSIAYALVMSGDYTASIWVVAACGGSLLVSYVKAKGETALKNTKLTPIQINRSFKDGLMRFEIRMFLLVIGLLLNYLIAVIMLIAILSWITAAQRLYLIYEQLNDVQN